MLTRQYQLLNLLIDAKSDYLPASYYSEKLSVSTKTIYSDLKQINEMGKQFRCEIKRKSARGIKITGSKNRIKDLLELMEELLDVDDYSLERRRIDIIKNVLLEGQTVTLEDMSNKYYISKTSLYNDIDYINKILKGNIMINSDIKGVYTIGEEIEMQNAVIDAIFHFSNLNSELSFKSVLILFFGENLVEEVYKIILQDYSNLVVGISEYYIQSLLSSIIVQVTRLKNDFHIINKQELTTYLNINIKEMDESIRKIYEQIEAEIKVEFDTLDQQYFIKQFHAHRVVDSIELLNSQYNQSIMSFTKRMSYLEGVNFTQNNKLIESLVLHVPAMILRLQLGIHIQNPLLRSIKDAHSILFSEVWHASSVFEQTYKVNMNDDEVSLLVMHFQIAIEKYKKSNNVVIVCQYGSTTSQLIYSKVRSFLPENDNVIMSNLEELKEMNLKDIDLIITSVDINNEDLPIVKVSPMVNNQDYINIITTYTGKVLKTNQNTFDDNRHSDKRLKEYVEKSLIFNDLEFSNKNDFLDFAIDQIESKKLVTDEYRASIFDREKIGSTGLESGVALPHANPSTIIKSHIAIFSLKHLINWELTKVQLVIFVNVNDDDIDFIKEIYKEIYDVVMSKEKVEEIVNLNKEELLSLL